MRLLRDERPEQIEADERVGTDAAEHLAWVAETLASMPADMATSMSATQRIGPAEMPTIRRLLATLAAQYDLLARVEDDHGYVTVWFDRRRS
jgi:hypothetical protein